LEERTIFFQSRNSNSYYPFQISATDNKELEVDENKMGCLQEVLGSKWAVNKMVLTNS
jgi:hypothetical protein